MSRERMDEWRHVSPAASVLIQALTLGKVIDDISGKKLTEDAWLDTYLTIVNTVILGN